MASIFDSIMPKLAAKLIPQYGKTATLTKVTEGAFDATAGTKATTEASYTISCIVQPVSAKFGGENSAIQVGDVKITLQHLDASAVPEIGDKVTIDGTTYRVIIARAVYSGEQKAMHEAYIRK